MAKRHQFSVNHRKVPLYFLAILARRPERIVFRRRKTVELYGTREIDNRDIEQVYNYMETRIEALKHRIQELETEKEALQANQHRHAA
jgi:hypothetical protein